MSYNGTVRCGYCGTSGHNKRSCPELTKLAEEWEKSDDPYYQRRAEVLKNQRQSRPKHCSHCGEIGHTIRTCDGHQALVNTIAHDWFDARRLMTDRMKEHGLGIGSLLEYEGRSWNDEARRYLSFTYLVIVVDINYRAITSAALSNQPTFHNQLPLTVKVLNGREAGTTWNCSLPRCIIEVEDEHDVVQVSNHAKSERLRRVRLASGTKANIPSDIFDWKLLKKQVYNHLKR